MSRPYRLSPISLAIIGFIQVLNVAPAYAEDVNNQTTFDSAIQTNNNDINLTSNITFDSSHNSSLALSSAHTLSFISGPAATLLKGSFSTNGGSGSVGWDNDANGRLLTVTNGSATNTLTLTLQGDSENAPLTISNFGIRSQDDGRDQGLGGAIFFEKTDYSNDAELIFDQVKNVTFTNNVAQGGTATSSLLGSSGYGGAIYSGATVAINDGENLTFSNNLAKGGDANGGFSTYSGHGGAVYAQRLEVNDTNGLQFINNVAQSGTILTTGDSANSAKGGALYLTRAFNIQNSNDILFSGNRAESLAGSGVTSGLGGAIYAETSSGSGDIKLQNLTNLVFDSNAAIGADANTGHTSQSGKGGAMYLKLQSTGNVADNIDGFIFTNNLAQGGSAHNGKNAANSGWGGAIAIDSNNSTSTFTLTNIKNGVFEGNQALAGSYSNGGSVYNSGLGGAIYLRNINATFSGEFAFLNNKAGYTDINALDEQTNARGGAIFYDSLATNTGAGLKLHASGGDIVFWGNTHRDGEANGIYFGSTSSLPIPFNVTSNVVFEADLGDTIAMYDPMASQPDGWTDPTSPGSTFYTSLINITKEGAGDWLLGGHNDMQGGTNLTVNDGTLRLVEVQRTSGSLEEAHLELGHATNALFSLNANGTLAGHGEISALDIQLSGIISPDRYRAYGADDLRLISDIGTLKFNGPVTMNGATFNVDINDTESDKIEIDGTLTLNGNNKIDLLSVNPHNQDNILISTTGGITLNSGSKMDLLVAGQAEVDFLTAELEQDGFNYKLVTEMAWDSVTLDNSVNKLLAHGNFTLNGNGTFTVAGDLADRADILNSSDTASGWDGKTLTKLGEGTLILDGVNTYSGLTSVDQGTLILGSHSGLSSAQIAGDVDIASGAKFGGHGSVLGLVTVNSGATLAPGNSIGTLTVGDITFQTGSIYQIEANAAGQSDKLNVTGNATINGGTVDVIAEAGIWAPSTTYVIIDSANAITGQFDDVQTNLAFLDPTLDYSNPNEVTLTLNRNGRLFSSVAQTYNQASTGAGIESLDTSNPLFGTVLGMSAAQAQSAFNNLSGEIHGSLKSAMLNNSRYARNSINYHLDRSADLLGHLPEMHNELWVDTWYHDGHLKTDNNAAKLDNKGWGVVLGVDAYAYEDTTLGFALGYERTELESNAGRDSEAEVDAIHLFAYGRFSLGDIDIKGGLGYSWLDVDTTRHINVSTIQSKNEAGYDGNLLQAFIEGSHTFNVEPQLTLTPYLGLGWQRVKFDSFTENGTNAATTLHSHGKSSNQTMSTLGVRSQYAFNDRSALYTDLGWQHTFGSLAPEATLNFIGGANYTVKGVETNRNSLVFGAGINYELQRNMSVSAGYAGQFGDQSRDHAARIMWQFKF